MSIVTIGHSTRSIEDFIALLRDADVGKVVDIRTVPRSRTNPQFNKDVLPGLLQPASIDYLHLPALGGLRGRRKEVEPSPNGFWRNDSFRNYADYALTPAFRAGLDQLIALCADRNCAIMCAESLWWRCHRRIVADYLLIRGLSVTHILGPGHSEPARLTPGAVSQPDGTVIYPGEAQADRH